MIHPIRIRIFTRLFVRLLEVKSAQKTADYYLMIFLFRMEM